MQPVVHKIVKCTEHKTHLNRVYWPPEESDENFDWSGWRLPKFGISIYSLSCLQIQMSISKMNK